MADLRPVSLRIVLRALLMCALCFVLNASATQALDISTSSRINADAAMAWCATDASTTLSEVLTGACTPQPARPGDHARGLDARAFWLRLTLANSGTSALERWVWVGHPRLEEISLFVPAADGHEQSHGWQQLNAGIRTPMAQRHDVARIYGALPLRLEPGSRQTVWLRVASRTAIDLSTTLWSPTDFQAVSARTLFGQSLALGALFIVMLLSLLALGMTREWSYLFFSLSMFGELVLESFRAGVLQQFFWPAELPMQPAMAAAGSMLAVLGFSAYFRDFVPELRRTSLLYRAFWLLIALTLAAQLWSLAIDYRTGTKIWSLTVNGVLLTGIALAAILWREGSRSGRMLVLGFVFLAALELLRLGALFGWLPFFWGETIAGPWSLVLTTPAMLMSLVQRSKELKDKLILSENENEAKVRFLAQMSHELRTPLNTILGNAQLLARPNGAQLAPDGLNGIQNAGRHLLGMIDEILDHARGQAGKLTIDPQPVDWPEFLATVKQVASVMAMQGANAFSCDFRGEMPACTVIDAGRLRQVLDNLLTNAARHAPGAAIRLHCEASDANGKLLISFAVEDEGSGIPSADLERIFLPFERGTGNTRERGPGTGMGLAISRQLVRAMGGELTVVSTPGAGTCFRFAVIADIHNASNDMATVPGRLLNATHLSYQGARRRVLLVDDNLASIAVLRSLLLDCGFLVDIAVSGQVAMGFVNQVDLVLTDQFMNHGDGWMVLQECRRLHPQLIVVMISAAPPKRPRDLDMEINFDAVMMKPVEHASLLQCLGGLLALAWHESPDIQPLTPTPIADANEPNYPDANALAELRELMGRGELTSMMEWAEALKAAHPTLTAYADRVYAAARHIEFDELQRLCRPPKG